MEILAFIIFLIFFLPIVLIIFVLQNREEGTLEERKNNPDLNCNDWDFHWVRLNQWGRSKYKWQTYYLGPRGGYYYYSANGNKVYC